MPKFKVGDEVRVVSYHVAWPVMAPGVGHNGVIKQYSPTMSVSGVSIPYLVTLHDGGKASPGWWREQDLAYPHKFPSGSKVLYGGNKFSVVDTEDDKVRLEDDDGEFLVPEAEVSHAV